MKLWKIRCLGWRAYHDISRVRSRKLHFEEACPENSAAGRSQIWGRRMWCRGGKDGTRQFSHLLFLKLPLQVASSLELTPLHPHLPLPSFRLSPSPAQINATASWLDVWSPVLSFTSASSHLSIYKSDQDGLWFKTLQWLPTASKFLKETKQMRHSHHHWVPFQSHFPLSCLLSYSLSTL